MSIEKGNPWLNLNPNISTTLGLDCDSSLLVCGPFTKVARTSILVLTIFHHFKLQYNSLFTLHHLHKTNIVIIMSLD